MNEKAMAFVAAETNTPSPDIQAVTEGIDLAQANLNVAEPSVAEINHLKPDVQPDIIEGASVQQGADETGTSNTEKIYKHKLADGTEVSGTLEKIRAVCPVIGGMALEKAKVVCGQADRAQRMAEKGRAIRLAKEQEEQDRTSEIKEERRTTIEHKPHSDKPRARSEKPAPEKSNNVPILKRNNPPEPLLTSTIDLSLERPLPDAYIKTEHAAKSPPADTNIAIKADTKARNHAMYEEALKVAADTPNLPKIITEKDNVAVIAAISNSPPSMNVIVKDPVDVTTERHAPFNQHRADEDPSAIQQESTLMTAQEVIYEQPTYPETSELLVSSTDISEETPIVTGNNTLVTLDISEPKDQKGFLQIVDEDIDHLSDFPSDELQDTSDPLTSAEVPNTYQQLMEVIVEQEKSEITEHKIMPQAAEDSMATDSTEETPTLNIIEAIRSESLVAKEPVTMERVKADAHDAQPLELALAKLSIVLESTSVQPEEPVLALLAEITQSLVAEPAQIIEGMVETEPVAITPEVTQLFISLLQELGYEDPHQTLITFVSQHGINELVQSVIYLHHLAESGDQKEYLTDTPPLLVAVTANVPITTHIGRTILRIIRPEINDLPIAA